MFRANSSGQFQLRASASLRSQPMTKNVNIFFLYISLDIYLKYLYQNLYLANIT